MIKNIHAPIQTTAPVAEHSPANQTDIFYRLPKAGGDPYFGLSRSHYYELERAGKLKLVRLRRPGATRGVVLISHAAVRAIVEAAASEK